MNGSFGSPNPAIALATAPTPAPKPGPLHQVEFVIEIVGPKSVPASAIAVLLRPDWQGLLGTPKIWAMAPQDSVWQPLTAAIDGAYDSLVLTWPYVGAEGHLTSSSASVLAGAAERFAASIQRRALAMPPPNDVDIAARAVEEIAERLDIGVGVSVQFAGGVNEESIWRTAVELGLNLNGQGEFGWGEPSQVTLVPLQEPMQFTLAGVQSARQHEGITAGFSAPRSVDPHASLSAALHVADEFARRFQGFVFGDEGEPVTHALRVQYERNLDAAVAAFEQVGLVSGSAEALRLFGV